MARLLLLILFSAAGCYSFILNSIFFIITSHLLVAAGCYATVLAPFCIKYERLGGYHSLLPIL
jgi:hypothetical protein